MGVEQTRSRWRPGIAVQLAFTFVAIGVLVLTANFAAQRTISITTTRVLRAPVAPAVSPPVVIPPPAPAVVAEVLPPVDPALERRAQDFVRSAERYSLAVTARLGANSPELASSVDAAAAELRRAGGAVPAKSVKALLAGGEQLIATADQRRGQFLDYTLLIEAMNARMQSSIDGAWKILGRVVARQSVLTTSQRLADIRRNANSFARPDSYDADVSQQVGDTEAAFVTVLTREQDSLGRSQGKEWVARMQQDAAQMAALRAEVMRLDGELRSGHEQLTRDTATLQAQATASAARALLKAQRRIAAQQKPAPAAAPLPAAPPTPVPPEIAPLTDESVSTTVDPGDQAAARRFAWLSAGAMLLVLVLSVATALSIVAPVRRLIGASQRVAKGDAGARVPRGGNRELDALAIAFNDMASQLAQAQTVARGYQERLEGDVAERTRQLQHLAAHDPLTQLPNRRQLFVHLEALIAQAAQRREHVGLFFLDLDNFKNINDSMGHALGDRLLRAIAERLQEVIGVQGFAARLGGDEFTVVKGGGHTLDDMAHAGWDLVRAFQQPLLIDGRELLVSVSVGAGFYPDHAHDAESLLRAADAALFRAKALGRSQLTVFTPDLLAAAASKFSTEQGLRHAVDRGELELFYQPEVSLETLETTVVEALLRWRTADGGHLSPGEFLAVAEESGLIIEINDWVLRSGIMAAARWYRSGWSDVRVAINVSARQLFDVQFAGRVQALLEEHALPPQCLEIELTETVLQTGATTVTGLKRLQEMGVAIALDDFGTGYSSLASLEQLPLTRVKLDRSLIASIDASPRSAAIATAIIGLCKDLGMQITAEGVERPEQLAALRNSGVNIQGFLIARPVPESEVLATVAHMNGTMQQLLLEAPGGTAPLAARTVVATPEGISDTQRRRKLVLTGS
jgi:diguanylate cyclase (GGDEF)-like protein